MMSTAGAIPRFWSAVDDSRDGRLVVPPGAGEGEVVRRAYVDLGASLTHCEVQPGGGGRYVCEAIGGRDDSRRHRDPDHPRRIVTCRQCICVEPPPRRSNCPHCGGAA